MKPVYLALYMFAATVVMCAMAFQVSKRDAEIKFLNSRLAVASEQIADSVIGFEACKLAADEYEKCQAKLRHFGIRP